MTRLTEDTEKKQGDRRSSPAIAAQLAGALGRRDEEPNVVLGQALAQKKDAEGVAELVALLDSRDSASDAVKALYECGSHAPELLVPHVEPLVGLLTRRNNRLVWGGMTALACVARAGPDALWPHRAKLEAALETGSIITRDEAVRALCALAASSPQRGRVLGGVLLGQLRACRPKDLARIAGEVLPVLPSGLVEEARSLLSGRLEKLAASPRAKVERMLRGMGQRD